MGKKGVETNEGNNSKGLKIRVVQGLEKTTQSKHWGLKKKKAELLEWRSGTDDSMKREKTSLHR